MNTVSTNPPPVRRKATLYVAYAIAMICITAWLLWVFRDFHLRQAREEFSNVDWRWVVLGMAFDVISYGVQALRWKFLLKPFGKIHLARSIRAVYAGLFANLIFPLRPGEVLRSYVLSSSEEIPLGRVLGSVGVERFVDLVIATACLGVVSLFVDLPRRFERIADTLGIVTLVLLAIVVALVLYLELKLGREPQPEPGETKIPSKLLAILVDLHAMGTAPSFYTAVLTSLLMPFCQVLGLWAVMRAYSLHLSFLAAVVVLLVINLGVSLPNAPANVGAYQLFCVLGLSVFDVNSTTATGFSVFAFLALTFPLAFLGFAAALRSGFSLHSMREKVGSLSRQPRQPLKPRAQN